MRAGLLPGHCGYGCRAGEDARLEQRPHASIVRIGKREYGNASHSTAPRHPYLVHDFPGPLACIDADVHLLPALVTFEMLVEHAAPIDSRTTWSLDSRIRHRNENVHVAIPRPRPAVLHQIRVAREGFPSPLVIVDAPDR